ncbi:MAG TPA: L-threonylcarbamoyladenylate synthase [Spirochaetia bacterium]|nr:L-threonylcarbamoyladenylate synthase [Spirochaetia bacterium]
MNASRETKTFDSDHAAEAGRLIPDGELVVFPTETVYGLGANALDPDACRRLFAAKGRPADNPLIVHFSDLGSLEAAFPRLDTRARALLAAFSPGPLSVIVPKAEAASWCRISDVATAGLDTVAIRIPRHPVAAGFLRAAGVPVAAPSANLSGRPSPTTFEMARADMEGRVAAIIDGGDCEYGLESTVIEVRPGAVRILRHGVVTDAMVRSVLRNGDATVEPTGTMLAGKSGTPRSPGMKYAHYKPSARVVAVDTARLRSAQTAVMLRRLAQEAGTESGLLGVIRIAQRPGIAARREEWSGGRAVVEDNILTVVVESSEEYARDLYRLFVWFDAQGAGAIIAELPEPSGTGIAVRDRLTKASGGQVMS